MEIAIAGLLAIILWALMSMVRCWEENVDRIVDAIRSADYYYRSHHD